MADTWTVSPNQSIDPFGSGATTTNFTDALLSGSNSGNHPTSDSSGMAIIRTVHGSGVVGPQAADYGLTVSIIKDNFLNSTQIGEIDAITIVTRQGHSDTAGILANVGCVSGFSAILEGQSYQFAASSGEILKGCDVQIGGIETGETGAVDSTGMVINATTGAWATGLLIKQEGTGNFGSSIQIQNTNGVTLQVLNDGTVNGNSYFNGTEFHTFGTKVVGARDTGWTPGGGASPYKGGFNYGNCTLQQLATRVLALEAALLAHGLIG